MSQLNDFMRYANVISKSYQVPRQKLDLAVSDFLEQIAALEPKIASMPFFSIQELPNDWVFIKLYISLQNPMSNLPKGLHFDSYFFIDNMASCAIHGNDLQNQTAEGHDKLQAFLSEKSLVPTTPVFTEIHGDEDFTFTILKVGYTEAFE